MDFTSFFHPVIIWGCSKRKVFLIMASEVNIPDSACRRTNVRISVDIDISFKEIDDSTSGGLSSGVRGTGYGVDIAALGYFQNLKIFHSDEVKMKSIVLGGLSAQYTQRVFDCLIKR